MVETYSDHVLTGITELRTDPYQRAFDAVGDEYDLAVDSESLAAEYVEREAAATRLPETVRRLVESVGAHNRTGILTNGDGRMQRRKMAEHGLEELVDTVIVSNEVGSRKPDQAIFEEAKERLPAEAFVYVGDTVEEDITPARETGFETVYVGEGTHPDASVATSETEAFAGLLLPLIEEDPV
jgi:putative hydrolase of the HAD superfamily